MSNLPRIVLKLEGLEEMQKLAQEAQVQLGMLRETLRELDAYTMALQVKLNQPSADTDG